MSLDAIRAMILAAHDEVSAICKGKQWRMCIPVHPTDSDAVIGGALRRSLKLVKVAEAAKELIDARPNLAPHASSLILALEALETE